MSLVSTSGIRGRVGEDVTVDLALGLGRAIATDQVNRVVVGHDPRETSEWLVDALTAGLRECGTDVIHTGLVSTPTLARSVDWFGGDLGVMVTASHNPPEYNGFKLWNASAQALPPDRVRRFVDVIRQNDPDPAPWNQAGRLERTSDATNRHCRSIQGEIGDLSGLEVVVDIGNGAGGVTVDALETAGADVTPLHETPDGRFPNRPSEPTPDTCETLQDRVAETSASLGIALDGDADRMQAVTESGQFVLGDILLAIFAREAASRGEGIAAPINTSLAVDRALAAYDISVRRTRIGDTHVAGQAAEPDVAFGGEPSGAWIWPDSAMCPDGPLAACRLAEIVSRRGSLDALVEEIGAYPLRRQNVRTESKHELMDDIQSRVQEIHANDCSTVDGVHVEFEDGWFLIRPSGTEPVIRITAEGRTEERAADLISEAKRYVDPAVAR